MPRRNRALFALIAASSLALVGVLFLVPHSSAQASKATVYELTLSSSNSPIVSTSTERTANVSTGHGGALELKYNNLAPSSGQFASFSSGGYLYSTKGVSGFNQIRGTFTGDITVSFASSARPASGDWSKPVALTSAGIAAPDGMDFFRIQGSSGAKLTTLRLTYDCTGIDTSEKEIRLHWAKAEDKAKLYGWTTSGETVFGSWPGKNGTDSGAWYTYTYAPGDDPILNVIFNGDSGQTADLSVTGFGDHYYYNGRWFGYDPFSDELRVFSRMSHVWAWDSSGDIFNKWPGQEMEQVGDWYTYSFGSRSAVNVIFSNNGANQTSDLVASGFGAHYYDGSWHQGDSSHETTSIESSSAQSQEPSSEQGTSSKEQVSFPDKIYLTNNKHWSAVYAYPFGGVASPEWPGSAMTFVEENQYGEGIYSIDGMSAYTGVVFNDGDGTQTVDVTPEDLTGTDNAFYIANTKDGQDHYEVGSWKYVPSTPVPSSSEESSSEASTSSKTSVAPAAKLPDTVYLTNNHGWTSVHAYAYNSDTDKLADWPGVFMEYFKENESGQEVYRVQGVSSYRYIIFNGSGGQTVDLDANDLKGENAWWIKESQDGSGHFDCGIWTENGGAHLSGNNEGLTILHAQGWSVSAIKDNIQNIANAGYTAVLTSVLQPLKDYHESSGDTYSEWWRSYQPVGFEVASTYNSVRTNKLVNGDDDLKALTSAADAAGVRILVDVVANHLGSGSGNGGLHYQVDQFCPKIYDNTGETLHNKGFNVDDSNLEHILQGNFGGAPDLNTAHQDVQEYVYNYLVELIDDGVTGFRFDAAKHIETKYEAYGYGSDFWDNTLIKARAYAHSKNRPIYAFAEDINGQTCGRTYAQYINDAGFDSVTDGNTSGDWRCRSGVYGSSSFSTGMSEAGKNLVYGETHDNYYDGTTSGYQGDVNDAYALLTARAYTHTLYFARPSSLSVNLGTAQWGDGNIDFIKGANRLHQLARGTGEYLSKSDNAVLVERGNGLFALNKNGSSVEFSLHIVGSGNFKSLFDNSAYVISGDKITLSAGQALALIRV